VPLKPKGYQFHVDVPEATTLAKEADVRISGVPVGKVKTITPDKQTGRAQPAPGHVLGRGKGSAIAPSLRPRQASACIPPEHTLGHRRDH
jgi:hypothetical protein